MVAGRAHAVEDRIAAGAEHGFHVRQKLRLRFPGAYGDKVCLISADKGGVLRKTAPHHANQIPNLPVAHLAAVASVDVAEAVDVEDRHGGGMNKEIGVFQGEAAEVLPMLEPGQKVGFVRHFREHEELADGAAACVLQAAEVALDRLGGGFEELGLDAVAVLAAKVLRNLTELDKVPDVHVVLEVQSGQKPVGLLVVHDEPVAVVEQDDALADVLENGHGQGLEHVVAAVVKRRPVHQQQTHAVAENGIVDERIEFLGRRIEKNGVDRDDERDGSDDEDVLIPVLPRRADALAHENPEGQDDKEIGEGEMCVVKRLHLIGKVRDEGVARHIVHGDLPRDVDQEDQRVKARKGKDEAADQAASTDLVQTRKQVAEVDQAHQQPVDHQEVDA